MFICVFRFCRAYLGLHDKRCPKCGRLQEPLMADREHTLKI